MKIRSSMLVWSFFLCGALLSGADAEPANAGAYPDYLSFVDGLHVTGTPIEVDAEAYRLAVDGSVENPLSLAIGEIRRLGSERIYMELECPGFFVDKGHWTGVRVSEVLDKAAVKDGARTVHFTSIDGSYTQVLSLEKVLKGNVLLAYEFEDRPFAVYHGFPLRLAAEGEAGSVWVKWLGRIEVR